MQKVQTIQFRGSDAHCHRSGGDSRRGRRQAIASAHTKNPVWSDLRDPNRVLSVIESKGVQTEWRFKSSYRENRRFATAAGVGRK